MTTDLLPASRFVIAQSWWIASEIVRRHPSLTIRETHPGDGLYDCLTIVDSALRRVLDLNRHGRLHAPNNEDFEPLPWSATMTAAGGHDVVKTLEKAAGLAPPIQAAASGPKVLTYRLIARVLGSLVDDRHTWDARSGEFATARGGPALELFCYLETRRKSRDEFWILSKDGEPVSALGLDGVVESQSSMPVELLPAYRAAGSSMTALVGQVLGDVLP